MELSIDAEDVVLFHGKDKMITIIGTICFLAVVFGGTAFLGLILGGHK